MKRSSILSRGDFARLASSLIGNQTRPPNSKFFPGKILQPQPNKDRDQNQEKENRISRIEGRRFYGHPKVGNRKLGWLLLRKLAQQSVRPWICAGDFNEILEQHGKEGILPRAHWQMSDCRECLGDCGLQVSGSKATSSRGGIEEKILIPFGRVWTVLAAIQKGLKCFHKLLLLTTGHLARTIH
ncbi:UNVERIFIED_CONTAM: hypothetical protein Slati_0944600 [Sesamum latifolium]|uniref:Endonuclease/exonuclease/phosphatase n=1 Tax=Sesamum latifolium TaxID=2727402 RepID=A0AAW2XQ73_9LAMI